MQPTPLRLSQALWTAFRAAKPIHQQSFLQTRHTTFKLARDVSSGWSRPKIAARANAQVRVFSDATRKPEIEKKVEDAKQRIEQSLDSRADIAQNAEPLLKQEKDETIVHTVPEASSIVHAKETQLDDAPQEPKSPVEEEYQETKPPIEEEHKENNRDSNVGNYRYAEWASSQWQNSPLPSQIASVRFRATKRFSSFMDNLQSQVVVAAHHINDLTGYTGIERLKKDIEGQETAVQNARQHVKDSRDHYSEAIAMRSSTQREVNDLLHRKHAWSPTDLERFTNLYRSDHANEQDEQKAHQQLSEAEMQYEEASTRLAKSILARYHEEQIWSDKIRQMSTWGTWGLMGLNVLLFIVFQIAIEPWRRKRLVKGFEEKVQAALEEKSKVTDEKLSIIQAQRNGDQLVQEAVQRQPEGLVATAAEGVAEAIADAVSGATESTENLPGVPASEEIENAAEQVTQKELEDESQAQPLTPREADTVNLVSDTSSPGRFPPLSNGVSASTDIPIHEPTSANLPETWQEQIAAAYHRAVRTTTNAYAHYSAAFGQQFNDREHVVLSKKEVTIRVLEGVAAGVAVTCGVVFVVVRSR